MVAGTWRVRPLLGKVRGVLSGSWIPLFDPRLAALERVFRSPPMTRSLAEAIHLISPQLVLRPNETARAIWETDQNGACWAEYEALRDMLEALPDRMRILEIGPGLGRSLVFFSKKLGWANCELHAFEADGKSTKYTDKGPRFADSFCGTISELRRVLDYNGVQNVTIHDASAVAMRDLPGPFDLVYGFYNIGFHWSLEYFLDDLSALMGETGLGVFTVPEDFEPFDALKRFEVRILDQERVWPTGEREKLILLSQRN
jgi:hypothetical protein